MFGVLEHLCHGFSPNERLLRVRTTDYLQRRYRTGVRNFSDVRAPSQARRCQPGGGPGPGSPGQAPGTECCVVSGNAGGEAYTGSAQAAMHTREGIEPRYEKTTVGADMLYIMEGHIREANGQGLREPTGVEDRGTCTRQRRELGRSHGLLQGRG